MVAQVILNNRKNNIDKTLDYAIPEDMCIQIGMRVCVPLGRGSYKTEGIVISISDSSEYENLKPIIRALDRKPLCSEDIIKLCVWIKDKYFCSFYQALRLFLPPGLERGVREVKRIFISLEIPASEAKVLSEEMFAKSRKAQGRIMNILSENPTIMQSELLQKASASSSALSSLEKKGYIKISQNRVMRNAFDISKSKPSQKYKPTDEQKVVIDHLCDALKDNRFERMLLRGVTGSGKTEVFLQAIDFAIKCGKTAIMLVPEISLTPQMVKRFVSRFGENVAVLHSRLSQGERFDEWNRIKRGEVSVVVGARSAVFAPLQNIGIIILDEEHETSYKSDTTPRYHARDIAAARAKLSGAVMLLASATPSLSSYYKAKNGIYTLFEMNKRYNEMALPQVDIVDMRGELINNKNFSPLSYKLQREIGQNLENKSKTILFLNRRGYSTFVSCRECGYTLECSECSVSMTYHKTTNEMVCHYCGKTMPVPTICPECKSKHIKFFGTGTQKIEEAVKKCFPAAQILRMDTDTTSKKGGHEEILGRFARGEADILLGTQMVTKGLDFPDVTLVGVLAADTCLCMDDFRASERSFSLLTQVCGRAGRGDIPGRAVIQTYQPQNSTIKYAKEHDYINFYNSEINNRKHLNYPPFCDIISIMMTSGNEDTVKDFSAEIKTGLDNFLKHTKSIIGIVGPAPAPIARIQGQYRYRVLLKSLKLSEIHPLLSDFMKMSEKLGNKLFLSIDINPNNMI